MDTRDTHGFEGWARFIELNCRVRDCESYGGWAQSWALALWSFLLLKQNVRLQASHFECAFAVG